MNASLSLLPFVGTASSAESGAVPTAAPNDTAAAPFSRMLDRATDQPPARQGPAHRSPRAATAEAAKPERSCRDELPNETRELPRVKPRKSEERDEAASLAGACAVTGPMTPLEANRATPVSGSGGEMDVATTTDSGGDEGSASSALPTEAASTGAGVDAEVGAVLAEMFSDATGETSPALSELLAQATPEAAAEVPVPSLAAIQSELPPDGRVRAANSLLPPAPVASASVEATEAAAEAARPVISGAAAVPSAPEESRRVVRAARQARVEMAENPAGIGVAKTTATMKTAIKKEEIAGSALQFLPSSPGSDLPLGRNLPGSLPRRVSAVATGLATLDSAQTLPVAARADLSGALESAPASGVSAMARVTEVISREIRMFKRGGDDLVEVVLTPDAKTQISLRLQWRDGQVEVQARCDLGDYQSLNTQWAQLQSSLANQGVRLSHLSERVTTGFTEFFSQSGFAQNQQRQAPPEREPGLPESLPLPALPSRSAGANAPAPLRRSRHLDFWA